MLSKAAEQYSTEQTNVKCMFQLACQTKRRIALR
jgi:hypothetical protein